MYKDDYIKIKDLKHGYLYKIIARNAYCGIWIKDTKVFMISRHKFGDNFIDFEYHYDMIDFATAQPIEEIEITPFGEDLLDYMEEEQKILDYLNNWEDKLFKSRR